MGKSKFKFNHSKPLASELKPLASISQEIKKEIENTTTFASSNEVKVLGIVSSEELDTLFSDTSIDEKVCYYTLTGDSGIKSSNCIKIGFCFSNDVYKSTLIDELAKLLVYRCGVNLLVLSLKFMSDYCQNASYRHVDESLLKRLIYSIDRGMEIPIDSFFYTDSFGVYRLESSRIINPISEMRDDIFEKLIRYVTQNFFDVIIFDVSRCFSNRNLNVSNTATPP